MRTKPTTTLVFIAFITLLTSCISSKKNDSMICEKLTSSQSIEQALKGMGIGFMKIPSMLTDTNPAERYETQWIETISFNDVVQGLLFGVASEEKKYHKYVTDV